MKSSFKRLIIGLSLIFSLTSCSGFLPQIRTPSRPRHSSQTSEVTSFSKDGDYNFSTSNGSENPYNYYIEAYGTFQNDVAANVTFEGTFYLTSQYGDHLRLSDRSDVVSNNYQLHVDWWFLANRYGVSASFLCDRPGTYSFTVYTYNSEGNGLSETYTVTCLNAEETYHVAVDEVPRIPINGEVTVVLRVEDAAGNWIELSDPPLYIFNIQGATLNHYNHHDNHVLICLQGQTIGEGFVDLELYTQSGIACQETISFTVIPSYYVGYSFTGDAYISDSEEKEIDFTLHDIQSGNLVTLDTELCRITDSNTPYARIVEITSTTMTVAIKGDGTKEYYYVDVILMSIDGYDFSTGADFESEERYYNYYSLDLVEIYQEGPLSFSLRFRVRNDANQCLEIKSLSYNGNYGLVPYKLLDNLYTTEVLVTVTASSSGYDNVSFTVETSDGKYFRSEWGFEFN